MNKLQPTIVADISLAIGILAIVVRWWRIHFRSKKYAELRATHQHQPIFICEKSDGVRGNQVQIRGEAPSTALRPGLLISSPDGARGRIVEVYADDDREDVPDSEVPAGVPHTPIVVEITSGDWGTINHQLSTEGAVLFNLREPTT